MKKLLVFLTLALAALWLVAGPGAVGAYLRGWVPEWVEGWEGQIAHEFRPGWFSSRLELEWPDGTRAVLDGRHLPPARPGWLDLTGRAQTPLAEAPVELRGHLGLTGRLEIAASTTLVDWREGRRVRARDAAGRFVQHPSGEFRLASSASTLQVIAPSGGGLNLTEFEGRVDWSVQPDGRAVLALDLAARRDQAPRSGLGLRLVNIDRDAAQDLAAALEQLGRAEPGSVDARLAGLAAAGAWQALIQAGLEVSSLSLELDGDTRLAGAWRPGDRPPEIRGSGRVGTMLHWTAGLAGVVHGLPPRDAEAEARAWLSFLIDQGWLSVDDDTFTFEYPTGNPEIARNESRLE